MPLDRQLCRPPQPPLLHPLPRLHVIHLLLLCPPHFSRLLLRDKHLCNRPLHLAATALPLPNRVLLDSGGYHRGCDRGVDVVAGFSGQDGVDDG